MTKYHLIFSFQASFGFSRSDEFFHTASLARSACNVRNQSLIHQWFISGPWSIFQFLWIISSKNSRHDSWRIVNSDHSPDKMNCCLKSGIHKHSPNCRVHVEVFHFVLRSSIISPSHNRIDFVHVRHDCRGYVEIMWSFPSFSFKIPWIFWNTGSRRFPSALFCMQQAHLLLHPRERSTIQIQKIPTIPDSPLLRQVSPRCHPSTRQGKHLSASLENSALRQVSNLFASCLPVSPQLWVSQDLRM